MGDHQTREETPEEDYTLNAIEAAKIVDVHPQYLRRLVKAGDGPKCETRVRGKSKYYFRRSDLVAWRRGDSSSGW